eukprot:Rhum_TRINITY_DN8342_c0_g1::Rhum_TRINITY_DN8342_c0_g1_i1::g.27448::m.27448
MFVVGCVLFLFFSNMLRIVGIVFVATIAAAFFLLVVAVVHVGLPLLRLRHVERVLHVEPDVAVANQVQAERVARRRRAVLLHHVLHVFVPVLVPLERQLRGREPLQLRHALQSDELARQRVAEHDPPRLVLRLRVAGRVHVADAGADACELHGDLDRRLLILILLVVLHVVVQPRVHHREVLRRPADVRLLLVRETRRLQILPRQHRVRVHERREVRHPVRRKLRQVVLCHVRQLQQRVVEGPAALHDHLQQCHALDRGEQETVVRGDVDHGLDSTNGVVEHGLGVGDVVRDGQRLLREVCLQEQVCLDVRRVQLTRVHLERQRAREVRVQLVLVVSHGELRKLLCVGEKLQHVEQRRLVADALLEQRDGLMRQVVERRDAPDHGRDERVGVVVVVLGVRLLQALRRHQVAQHLLHDAAEEAGDGRVVRGLHAVVRGVLVEAAEEVRPREVVDRVLPLCDGACDDLGVDVLVKRLVQRRLDREGVVDELLVEGLLRLLDHDHSHTGGVELRTARPAHHLQHVGQREVDVALHLRVVELCALDDDKMRGEVDTPRERRGGHQDLQLARHEHVLHDVLVALRETGVVDADAHRQHVLQRLVVDLRHVVVQLLLVHLCAEQPLVVRLLQVRNQRYARQTRLATRRHEDDDRLHGLDAGVRHDLRVLLDRGEARLVHRGHAGAVVAAGVSLDVQLERNGANLRPEVVKAHVLDAHPRRKVRRVRKRRGEPDHADLAAEVPAHVPHAADDHLEDRTTVASEHVDLVDHHKRDALHVRPALPVPRDAVPLLGRAAEDVRLAQLGHVGRVVAGQLEDRLPKDAPHPLRPVLHPFLHQRLQRRDVHDLVRRVRVHVALVEHAEDGELGCHRLPGPGGRTEQDVVVAVVEGVEALRLHRVQVRELHDLAVAGHSQHTLQLEGSQGEQLSEGTQVLRHDDAVEEHVAVLLRVEEAVGDGADDVVCVSVADGQREVQLHLLQVVLGVAAPLAVALAGGVVDLLRRDEHELAVVALLAVGVLDEDVPRLRAAVVLLRPPEVRDELDLHADDRGGDGRHLVADLHRREVLHELLHQRRVLVVADERSDRLHLHAREAGDRALVVLQTLADVVRQLTELDDLGLRLPRPPLDHLRQLQEDHDRARDLPLHRDLEQRAADPARVVRDVLHVVRQRERLARVAGNPRLDQRAHLHLSSADVLAVAGEQTCPLLLRLALEHAVVRTHLHQLLHLVLAHADLVELRRLRDEEKRLAVVVDDGAPLESLSTPPPDGLVLDVEVRSHPAHVHGAVVVRRRVCLVPHHLRRVQALRRRRHQLHRGVAETRVLDEGVRLQAVRQGVLAHPDVEVGELQPLVSLFPRVDGAQHDLGVQVVCEVVLQLRLDGHTAAHRVDVVGQLVHGRHDDALAVVVVSRRRHHRVHLPLRAARELRTTRTSEDLAHVEDRDVRPATLGCVVHLRAVDDDRVRGKVDTPRERGRAHEQLEGAFGEELDDERPGVLQETGVVDADARREKVLQLLAAALAHLLPCPRRHILLREQVSVLLLRHLPDRLRNLVRLRTRVHEDQNLLPVRERLAHAVEADLVVQPVLVELHLLLLLATLSSVVSSGGSTAGAARALLARGVAPVTRLAAHGHGCSAGQHAALLRVVLHGGGHSLLAVLDADEALQQGHRTVGGVEHEQPGDAVAAEEVADVPVVRQRRGQADESDGALRQLLLAEHARYQHLDDRTSVLVQQVDLVEDDKVRLRHEGLRLLPRQHVPLLRRRDDQVRLRHLLLRHLLVSGALADHHVVRRKRLREALHHLLREGLHRRHVHHLELVLHQRALRRDVLAHLLQHRQERAHRLTRACRRRHKHVLRRVERRLKHLRLHPRQVRLLLREGQLRPRRQVRHGHPVLHRCRQLLRQRQRHLDVPRVLRVGGVARQVLQRLLHVRHRVLLLEHGGLLRLPLRLLRLVRKLAQEVVLLADLLRLVAPPVLRLFLRLLLLRGGRDADGGAHVRAGSVLLVQGLQVLQLRQQVAQGGVAVVQQHLHNLDVLGTEHLQQLRLQLHLHVAVLLRAHQRRHHELRHLLAHAAHHVAHAHDLLAARRARAAALLRRPLGLPALEGAAAVAAAVGVVARGELLDLARGLRAAEGVRALDLLRETEVAELQAAAILHAQ